jgi:hypothetical protein
MSQYHISVPKTCTNLQHRKVSVVEKEDGSPLNDLQDLLLACDAEPKDLLPMFVPGSVDFLMRLDSVWDVFLESYGTCPEMFDDSASPEAKLIHGLLVKKQRPMSLVDTSTLGAVTSLLTMQRGWEGAKENSIPAAPICDFCGVSGPVLRCSGCMEIRKEIRYCNRVCQESGWKKHKKAGCGRYASKESKDAVKKACAKK